MKNHIYAKTNSGKVKGEILNGYCSFKGIPYARAERFCPPQPVTWEEILDCTDFGKKAMQDFEKEDPRRKPQSREEFDEDCLNLNVYLPRKDVCVSEEGWILKQKQGLPVLVEIHGGAFQTGSNQDHTPKQIIREHDFIYVAVNYRLGVWGFLYLGKILGKEWEGSANNGILDLMASVRWIYENISAFGGDPRKITLMGSSAGAKSMGAMMCAPELKKYVHQAILSSGGTQSIRSIATAQKIAEDFLDVFRRVLEKHGYGREKAEERLLRVSSDLLLEAQRIFCDNPGNTCMFGPVKDGVFLPETLEEILLSGTLWEGSAMIGSSRHEMGSYKDTDPDLAANAPGIADSLFGKNAPIAQKEFSCFYRNFCEEHGRKPSPELQADWWVQILTDNMYRLYSYRLARRLAKKGCRVWQYTVEFEPALHCFDQTLAFDEPDPELFKDDGQLEKAARLGKKIYRSFVNFIEKGDPGKELFWPCLEPEHPIQMAWDEESGARKIAEGDVLEGFGEEVYVR